MRRECVLLVDDEPNITAGLKRALRREPYEILTANSAQEGLEILAAQPVDVVVSDEQMPGMSGSEFLRNVCRKYPNTVRMMLTGQASLEAAIRAINEGEVYRFFTKPCNDADLRLTIRNALQQQILMRQSRRLLREYQRWTAERRAAESGVAAEPAHAESGEAIVIEEIEGNVDDLLREIENQIEEADEVVAST
jgi:two-component system, probable response regulator PhcQ